MVAGEASADLHASRVVRQLKQAFPDAEIFGMGGPEMQRAGMECVYGMDALSVMGFTDVIPKLGSILAVLGGLKKLIRSRRPDIFIPIDLPDFNMRLSAFAKKSGVKVLYYIAPQAWAWRKERAKTMARITDGLAVIFPFEEAFFAANDVNARYVGHPFMEEGCEKTRTDWPPTRIALMPGSREQEIGKLLPVMLQAKAIIDQRHSDLEWFLPLAPGVSRDVIRDRIVPHIDIKLTDEIPAVDLAMVKSGTATFEMALKTVPEVICYTTSALNYRLARTFIQTEFIGMPNIICGRKVVPELIQHEFTPRALADEITRYIQDSTHYLSTREAFKEMRLKMGAQNASEGVCNWVKEMLI